MVRRFFAAVALVTLLGACGRDLEEWLADLTNHDPYVRVVAANALLDADVPDGQKVRVLRMLVRTSRDQNGDVREAANATIAVRLKLLLEDTCRTGNAEFAEMLAEQSWRNSLVDDLLAALEDPGCQNRAVIAKVLATHGALIVSRLIERLRRPDLGLQAAVIAGITELGADGRGAIVDLFNVVAREGTDSELGRAALDAIDRIAFGLTGTVPPEDHSAGAREVEVHARRALIEFLCTHPDDEVAARGLLVLARAAPGELAVEGDCGARKVFAAILARLAKDENAAVAAQARETLEKTGR